MDFSIAELDDKHRTLQQEIRSFMEEHITDEVRAEDRRTGEGFVLEAHLAMGERGWIMPEWPVERGGAGFDKVSMRILEVEMARANIPWVALGTTRLVLAAVEQYGSDAIREDICRGVARGEIRFCLGYTEPDGGSDIAAAKTRAVRDGDEWEINGSKMFTTGAQNCQYVFLITRSDPDLPKHKGLTMFLVPLDTPGIEIQPLHAFSGERTNIVYYDKVHISDDHRLGAVNDGWAVLHGPLDAEHSIGDDDSDGLGDLSVGSSFLRELDLAVEAAALWASTPQEDGTRPADDPIVGYRIGKVATELIAGYVTPGPLGRVKGADATVKGSADLLDLLGMPGLVSDPRLAGQPEFAHRYGQGASTYGGTVEVFRNIIAEHQLGLPRADYPGRKTFIRSSK